MTVVLSGKDYGKKWEVSVEPSAFGGFIAIVYVGSAVRASSERYAQFDEAKQAGCDLLAGLFDDLELSHAA